MNTRPDVGASSPAMQCRSVDFPDPEGPMIALNRPRSNSTETASSARTAASPRPYTFESSTALAAALVAGAGGIGSVIADIRRSPSASEPNLSKDAEADTGAKAKTV
jgi:hypothetical protein